MKRVVIATVCSALAGLMGGCNYAFPDSGGDAPDGGGGYGSAYGGTGTTSHGGTGRTPTSGSRVNTALVQPGGHMAGAMGNITRFSSDAVEVQFAGTAVTLNAVNPDQAWWVMTRLMFNTPLSDPGWAPGLERTFTQGVVQADGLGVSAVGCSGPSRGDYTFDADPDQVTIHVMPGTTPDEKLVSFSAYWSSGSQVVTGTFAYRPG